MKIKIIRKMAYKKHFIHVMQFGFIFQYLLADKDGNIYQDYIEFKPKFIKVLMFKLGLIKNVYSKEDMDAGEEIVLSGAMKTIDTFELKQDGAQGSAQDDTPIQTTKAVELCTWRAVPTDDTMSWECLDHNKIIPMKDGEKPSHEEYII